MNLIPPRPSLDEIVYPMSDGERMSDNDKQFRWIAMLEGNIAAIFRDQPNVKVGGDMLWYPVEGEPKIRAAPDVYVVFGRPKGDRDSWLQWKEDNVPMTVVFEVLSLSNTHKEMVNKLAFYEEYGADEYYEYNPYEDFLLVYVRRGEMLRRVTPADGFVSPRLGIRFDLSTGPEMVVRYPNGEPFLKFEELKELQEQATKRADDEKKRADDEKKRAEDMALQIRRLKVLARKYAADQLTDAERAELNRLLGEDAPTE